MVKHGNGQRPIRRPPNSTQDDAICIECSNIAFSSQKSTQLTESNDPVVPYKVPESSAPNDTETPDMNKELNTYKARLALEVNNLKKKATGNVE